jgi:hypothetical protein
MTSGSERHMYKPYIELTNAILSQCHPVDPSVSESSELDILCLCNDPNVIIGEHQDNISYSKPDLVLVNWKTVLSNESQPPTNWDQARQWASESFENKRKIGLDWSQVLMVNELKKSAKVTSEDISKATSYVAPLSIGKTTNAHVSGSSSLRSRSRTAPTKQGTVILAHV